MQTRHKFPSRMGLLAAAFIFSFSLAACGGGGGGDSKPADSVKDPVVVVPPVIPPAPGGTDTDATRLQALEQSGALPKLSRAAESVDADNNGVRDDLDAIFAATYADPAQRAAANQYAAALGATLLFDRRDQAAVKALAVRGSRAINCIYTVFAGGTGALAPASVVRSITAMTTDTEARLTTYLNFSKAVNGTVLTLPEGNTCE